MSRLVMALVGVALAACTAGSSGDGYTLCEGAWSDAIIVRVNGDCGDPHIRFGQDVARWAIRYDTGPLCTYHRNTEGSETCSLSRVMTCVGQDGRESSRWSGYLDGEGNGFYYIHSDTCTGYYQVVRRR